MCVINNNAGSELLSSFATSTYGGGISTKPARTAILNGVTLRLLTRNGVGALHSTHEVVDGSRRIADFAPDRPRT